MKLADTGREVLPVRSPEVLYGVDLFAICEVSEVVGDYHSAALGVPDTVLRPYASAQFPARIATPTPLRVQPTWLGRRV